MPLPPPFAHIKAVVFDFDGTLAHLTLDFNVLNSAVHDAVRGVFPAAPPFAPPALEWVAACAQIAGQHQPELAASLRLRAEEALLAVEVDAARRGALFPHTRDLLLNLRENGLKAGVITRNCRPAVLAVFPDLEEYCPLLAREDVPETKPNPEHLLRMLDILKTPPQNGLMVGDHPLDILTGKRAGTMTLGVACGHSSYKLLREAGPDLILEHCGRILQP